MPRIIVVNDDGTPATPASVVPAVLGLLGQALAALRRFAAWLAPSVVTAALTFGLLNVHGCTPPPVPVPPAPTPTPAPTDPLVESLQAAYAADTDPQKAAHVPALAGVLPQVVANAKATGKLVNLSDLEAYAHGYVDTVLGAGTLPAVRKAGSAYVASKMPAVDGPLNDALYATAAAAYGDVAKALGNVRRGK